MAREGASAHDPGEAPEAVLGKAGRSGLAQQHFRERLGFGLDRAEHAFVGLPHQPRVLFGVDPLDLLVGPQGVRPLAQHAARGVHRDLDDAQDHRREGRGHERSGCVGEPAPAPRPGEARRGESVELHAVALGGGHPVAVPGSQQRHAA
jgi:hypothetical protein